MLREVNNLSLLFEDRYRGINVGEYYRLVNISPPFPSKFLKNLDKQGILKIILERRTLLSKINSEYILIRDLSRIYRNQKLQGIIGFITKEISCSSIVLFGSLLKLEFIMESGIHIVILVAGRKNINFLNFEKKIGRKIKLFFFESLEKVNNQLNKNITYCHLLVGYLL
jgi:predicted nucleotidyltransferase